MNNSIPDKFLPIGTVVMLKGGEKRVMIAGFCCVDDVSSEKMYDYAGVLYPEGIVATNKNLLFDHEQIEKVYALGFSDEEDKAFKEKLTVIDNELRKQQG